MHKHKGVRESDERSVQNHKKPLTQDDLTELVLGPLADQIDRVRQEVLAAIQKINDSTEVIAHELARQVTNRGE